MFRRIKKWYFKIYHLFKLISVFILVFGLCNRVYAEEYNTCFDKYKIGTVSFYNYTSYYKVILPFIPITETSTTYYVRFFPAENYTGYNNVYFGNASKAVHKNGSWTDYYTSEQSFDVNKQILSFKTNRDSLDDIKGINLLIYTYNTNFNVLKDSPIIISTNLDEIMECEDTPTQDSVYTSFLTLYTDKISYLANGFTSNPYLLAMIGIIFSFVVLELFLKILHLKGGKHR